MNNSNTLEVFPLRGADQTDAEPQSPCRSIRSAYQLCRSRNRSRCLWRGSRSNYPAECAKPRTKTFGCPPPPISQHVGRNHPQMPGSTSLGLSRRLGFSVAFPSSLNRVATWRPTVTLQLSLTPSYRSHSNKPKPYPAITPPPPLQTPLLPQTSQHHPRPHHQRRPFATRPALSATPLHPRFAIMATNDDAAAAQHVPKEFPPIPSLESLHERLKSLSITEEIPVFPDSNPTTNPVDIYRCIIAHHLAPITGVDINLVYPALEWTQTLDKGDLVVPVPRLRVKGRKPEELATEWAEKVLHRTFPRRRRALADLTGSRCSSRIALISSAQRPKGPSCASTSKTASSTMWSSPRS